ncbi:MAG: cation:proton antiporter [Spirochaetae bacterium HGW-Spirochaetae-1]|jgi:multicomponent Na+:H+ antiporter subunit E|nr:MAG: cation:proton antiporter [Spirochaetae bacterium HGW-Spirochaetae-1]
MKTLFCSTTSLILYLALTAGSGEVLLFWSIEELVVGVIVSIFVGLVSSFIIPDSVVGEIANPLKWIAATFYMVGPFLLALLMANIEVLYRIMTGNIHPAIVKVESDLKSETGTYFFANSITLSPGTLTIAVDEETHAVYVHCLEWKKEKGVKAEPNDVCLFAYFWMKKIFG